jgi:GxxExxY protein
MDIDRLTRTIIGCAYKVHQTLGAGFREKIYENALTLELNKLGIEAKQQDKIQVFYEGQLIGDYSPDLWIEGQLIIEIKGVERLLKEHEIQLVNYLAATGIDNGLLINFGASVQVKRKFREYKPKALPSIKSVL